MCEIDDSFTIILSINLCHCPWQTTLHIQFTRNSPIVQYFILADAALYDYAAATTRKLLLFGAFQVMASKVIDLCSPFSNVSTAPMHSQYTWFHLNT